MSTEESTESTEPSRIPHATGSGIVLDSDRWFLPLQGRAERLYLYKWIAEEEMYVAAKFDDQRNEHDDSMRSYDLEDFWIRQVIQYLDRARIHLNQAGQLKSALPKLARGQELRAQQAMAKAMMTAKGMVESSIRVYGPLPKPGVTSGEIEPWIDI